MIRFLRTPERPFWGVVSGAVRPQAVFCLETGFHWDLLRGDKRDLFLHLHETNNVVSVRWAEEGELNEFISVCSLEQTEPCCRKAIARLKSGWVIHPVEEWDCRGNHHQKLVRVDGGVEWVEA